MARKIAGDYLSIGTYSTGQLEAKMEATPKIALFLAGASAAAAWLVVPELRCGLELPMAAGQCAGGQSRTAAGGSNPPDVKSFLPPRESPPIQIVRSLSEADLEGKSNWELDVMRNEIYARHGRGFNREDLRAYFAQFSWYHPIYSPEAFDQYHQDSLSPTERANAEFILDYQRWHTKP
jgi:hypothetical protein